PPAPPTPAPRSRSAARARPRATSGARPRSPRPRRPGCSPAEIGTTAGSRRPPPRARRRRPRAAEAAAAPRHPRARAARRPPRAPSVPPEAPGGNHDEGPVASDRPSSSSTVSNPLGATRFARQAPPWGHSAARKPATEGRVTWANEWVAVVDVGQTRRKACWHGGAEANWNPAARARKLGPPMDLTQLRYFRAIAHAGNMTGAAR